MNPTENLPNEERLAGLAAFLPVFTAPDFKFGYWEPQIYSTGHFHFSREASSFVKTAYNLGWVRPDINWGEWQHTEEVEILRTDREELAEATPEQLAKLLTLYIRGERFCDGALESAFESRLLVGIFKRADTLLSEIKQ